MDLQSYFKNNNIIGFGLIEIMIASSILALALLGIPFIQSKAFGLTRESIMRDTAISLIEQISKFIMTMQPTELSNLFLLSPTDENCIDHYCTRSNFYAAIVSNWKFNNVVKSLPNGAGKLCVLNSSSNLITIRASVKWQALSGVNKFECIDHKIILPAGFVGLAATFNCPAGSAGSCVF